MKNLTISIAAYNVENYLDNLMESIIRSDVMDLLEILIINDGSRDKTPEIAKRYQNEYPDSIRLIDKTNGGHGSTINKGIEEATGKYFRALDGDDWINDKHLANLVRNLNEIDADIILSNYCMCYEDGRNVISDEFSDLTNGKRYLFDEIWHPGFWMRYHTVIFRTDILKDNKIRLDENSFYVDVEFMLFPIPYVNTIYYIKDHIYCYRIGIEGQSVSDSSRMKNIGNSDMVGRHLIDYYNENKERLSVQKQRYFFDEISFHCKWHEESLFLFPLSKSRKKEFIGFEKYIEERAPEVYKQMEEESKVLAVLRRTGYSLYNLAVIYKKVRKRLQNN